MDSEPEDVEVADITVNAGALSLACDSTRPHAPIPVNNDTRDDCKLRQARSASSKRGRPRKTADLSAT